MNYKHCPHCGYDLLKSGNDDIKISSGEDILPLVDDIKYKCQEHVVVITLNASYNIIEKRVVFIGTLNESIIHPREVFVEAITDRAAGIIIAHNHPTSDINPSKADMEITKRLIDAGDIIGIPIIDHIIIGKTDKYFSFKNMGMI